MRRGKTPVWVYIVSALLACLAVGAYTVLETGTYAEADVADSSEEFPAETEKGIIPDLKGMNYTEAVETAEKSGYTVAVEGTDEKADAQEALVTSQTESAGDTAAEGDEAVIHVQVSTPPAGPADFALTGRADNTKILNRTKDKNGNITGVYAYDETGRLLQSETYTWKDGSIESMVLGDGDGKVTETAELDSTADITDGSVDAAGGQMLTYTVKSEDGDGYTLARSLDQNQILRKSSSYTEDGRVTDERQFDADGALLSETTCAEDGSSDELQYSGLTVTGEKKTAADGSGEYSEFALDGTSVLRNEKYAAGGALSEATDYLSDGTVVRTVRFYEGSVLTSYRPAAASAVTEDSVKATAEAAGETAETGSEEGSDSVSYTDRNGLAMKYLFAEDGTLQEASVTGTDNVRFVDTYEGGTPSVTDLYATDGSYSEITWGDSETTDLFPYAADGTEDDSVVYSVSASVGDDGVPVMTTDYAREMLGGSGYTEDGVSEDAKTWQLDIISAINQNGMNATYTLNGKQVSMKELAGTAGIRYCTGFDTDAGAVVSETDFSTGESSGAENGETNQNAGTAGTATQNTGTAAAGAVNGNNTGAAGNTGGAAANTNTGGNTNAGTGTGTGTSTGTNTGSSTGTTGTGGNTGTDTGTGTGGNASNQNTSNSSTSGNTNTSGNQGGSGTASGGMPAAVTETGTDNNNLY